jgi:hypothetical protein
MGCWACCAKDFCSALAARNGPEQNIFTSRTLFQLLILSQDSSYWLVHATKISAENLHNLSKSLGSAQAVAGSRQGIIPCLNP